MDAGDDNRAAHRRLVLLGPPGSGKGTQAQRLEEHLKVPAISTGDMLRAARDAGSGLGERVRGIMAAGELVDDATMAEVVRERLEQKDAASGFLLDGYPRTLRQANDLEEILGTDGDLDAVVLIQVPDDVLVERALGRGREDDREDVVRTRLAVYREKTEPLVGYYQRSGLLWEVNGKASIDEVTRRILQVLGADGTTPSV